MREEGGRKAVGERKCSSYLIGMHEFPMFYKEITNNRYLVQIHLQSIICINTYVHIHILTYI